MVVNTSSPLREERAQGTGSAMGLGPTCVLASKPPSLTTAFASTRKKETERNVLLTEGDITVHRVPKRKCRAA